MAMSKNELNMMIIDNIVNKCDQIIKNTYINNNNNMSLTELKNLVGWADIVKYFEKFYSLIIKPKLNDGLAQSQWNYFISMFKTDCFEKYRVEQYLNILDSEKNLKKEIKKPIPKPPLFFDTIKNSIKKHEQSINQQIKDERRTIENSESSILKENNCIKIKERKVFKIKQQSFFTKKKNSETNLKNELKLEKVNSEPNYHPKLLNLKPILKHQECGSGNTSSKDMSISRILYTRLTESVYKLLDVFETTQSNL